MMTVLFHQSSWCYFLFLCLQVKRKRAHFPDQPKRTKAMDMRFHWLRDRQCQEQFRIYWKPGKLNYADYWTKHHAAKHHQAVRPEFISSQRILDTFKHSSIEGAMLVTALGEGVMIRENHVPGQTSKCWPFSFPRPASA